MTAPRILLFVGDLDLDIPARRNVMLAPPSGSWQEAEIRSCLSVAQISASLALG
jgi:hypothetical protein